MPAGPYSMMFIYTYKEWDDVPQQLIVLNICLVSLQPLTMCLLYKYFKLSISCVFKVFLKVLKLKYLLVLVVCLPTLFHYIC